MHGIFFTCMLNAFLFQTYALELLELPFSLLANITMTNEFIGPSFPTIDQNLYFIESGVLKVLKAPSYQPMNVEQQPNAIGTATGLSCAPKAQNCYIFSTFPSVFPSGPSTPLFLKNESVIFGEYLIGAMNSGKLAIVDLASGNTIRSPVNLQLSREQCTYLQQGVIICSSGNGTFEYSKPFESDDIVKMSLPLIANVSDLYKGELILGCRVSGIDTVSCGQANITSNLYYGNWTIKHSFSKERIESQVEVLGDQYMIAMIASNNSIVFYNSRTGEYFAEIKNPSAPNSLYYNRYNQLLSYSTATNILLVSIKGPRITAVEGCVTFDKSRELCLECQGNSFPSANLTSCWDIIPDNWYTFTWGAGGSDFLFVEFMFNENEILADSKKFVSELSIQNLRIKYKGNWDTQKYFFIFDETTPNDQERMRKRFRIQYNRDIERSEIDIKFAYPDFNSLIGCPVFNLRFLNPKTYVIRERIPSHWHNPFNFGRTYKLYAIAINVMIFALQMFITFVRPFMKGMHNRTRAFWVVKSVWFLQGLNLLGCAATNYRGVLGTFMRILAEENFKYFGADLTLSLSTDNRNVFLGKFTSYNIKNEMVDIALWEMIVYVILLILSLALRDEWKKRLINMRIGYFYCNSARFIIFSLLSIEIFVRSNTSNISIWFSFISSVLFLIISLSEFYMAFTESVPNSEAATIVEKFKANINKHRASIRTYLFADFDIHQVGFDYVKTSQTLTLFIERIKRKKKNKQKDDIYYEINEEGTALVLVDESIIKKLRAYERDSKGNWLLLTHNHLWLIYMVILGLLTVESILQTFLLLALSLTSLILVILYRKNLADIVLPKKILIIIQSVMYFVITLGVFILSLDSTFPMIALSVLKPFSNWMIRLILLSWLFELFLIAFRFSELKYNFRKFNNWKESKGPVTPPKKMMKLPPVVATTDSKLGVELDFKFNQMEEFSLHEIELAEERLRKMKKAIEDGQSKKL